MSPGKSRLLLGGGLVITLLAAWFAPPPKDDGLVLSERAQNAGQSNVGVSIANPIAPHATSASNFDVLSIRPRASDAEEDVAGGRLFASSQWKADNKQVATNVVADVPTPPPQAPPLPFRFLGRYADAGQSVIFLQYNEQNLVVRLGDTLGEQYKVEKLDGTTLSLRYLPLNQVQSLDTDASR